MQKEILSVLGLEILFLFVEGVTWSEYLFKIGVIFFDWKAYTIRWQVCLVQVSPPNFYIGVIVKPGTLSTLGSEAVYYE